MVGGGRVYGQTSRLVLRCWWLEGGCVITHLWDGWRRCLAGWLWGIGREVNVLSSATVVRNLL